MATAQLIFANMIYSLHSMSKNVHIDHYFIYSASYTYTKYLYIKIIIIKMIILVGIYF